MTPFDKRLADQRHAIDTAKRRARAEAWGMFFYILGQAATLGLIVVLILVSLLLLT